MCITIIVSFIVFCNVIFTLKEWFTFSEITAFPLIVFPAVGLRIIVLVLSGATVFFLQEENEIEKRKAKKITNAANFFKLNAFKLIVFIIIILID